MKVEEPIVSYGQLDVNKSYTYFDYLKWQFKERVELIKGKIVKMSPAPNVNHQQLLTNNAGAFFSYFNNDKCRLFLAPFDVRLNIPDNDKDKTVVQPDICVICDDSKLDEQGCNGSPELIVEILSPSNQKHDLNTKFFLYEEAGVKEYWIIDPINRSVNIYTLKNKKYIGLNPFVEGMMIRSILFPSLEVSVDKLFYKVK